MSDIVPWLREFADFQSLLCGDDEAPRLREAADEIELLREALEAINRMDTYSAKSYGPFAKIARDALGEGK